MLVDLLKMNKILVDFLSFFWKVSGIFCTKYRLVFIGDTLRDFGHFWRQIWNCLETNLPSKSNLGDRFDTFCELEILLIFSRSTSIFLIFPLKINGNIGINSWNSTDLAGILLRRWEKFHRHVGGIYHQIQTGLYGDIWQYGLRISTVPPLNSFLWSA